MRYTGFSMLIAMIETPARTRCGFLTSQAQFPAPISTPITGPC